MSHQKREFRPSQESERLEQAQRPSNLTSKRKGATLFVLASVLVLGLAVTLFTRPYFEAGRIMAHDGEQVITISMSGWTPPELHAKAGEPITITMVNLDSRFHLDGMGWHDFNIDELQRQELVGPKESLTFTLTVDEPGEYTFYCSTCCGGKASPSMRGRLTVS